MRVYKYEYVQQYVNHRLARFYPRGTFILDCSPRFTYIYEHVYLVCTKTSRCCTALSHDASIPPVGTAVRYQVLGGTQTTLVFGINTAQQDTFIKDH